MTRRYPVSVSAPAKDTRFTFGLVMDVAEVLAAHGCPVRTADEYDGQGRDLLGLQMALYRLIHIPEAGPAGLMREDA
ncbi:hypothetical protein C6361_26750 [Plantactinospora sp. BC1]|uniref:hypothetical protein n=1 Tax=Plantactinospora sp. BC1 TaxID=2108470 RepID=UPI000D16D68A|nr:hypothetical protein [Plantactinospora sp. BC1]AVT34831.1 hypothetical protein C6361_26750 [Plantactinospora sp. BC1]